LEEEFKSNIVNCPWRSLRASAYITLLSLSFSWDNLAVAYSYAWDQDMKLATSIIHRTTNLLKELDATMTNRQKALEEGKIRELIASENIRRVRFPDETHHPVELKMLKPDNFRHIACLLGLTNTHMEILKTVGMCATILGSVYLLSYW
jgi:hypothetical protein